MREDSSKKVSTKERRERESEETKTKAILKRVVEVKIFLASSEIFCHLKFLIATKCHRVFRLLFITKAW